VNRFGSGWGVRLRETIYSIVVDAGRRRGRRRPTTKQSSLRGAHAAARRVALLALECHSGRPVAQRVARHHALPDWKARIAAWPL